VAWRKTSGESLRRNFLWPIVIGLLGGALHSWARGIFMRWLLFVEHVCGCNDWRGVLRGAK